MRRWAWLDPRNHFVRSDGRLILGACVIGLALLSVPIVTSHMGPSARGTDSTPSPAPDAPEVHGEREAIRQDERDENANWIWQPSEAEIATHREGSAMLFVGPIVAAETGERLEADVYINDRPVARADRVAVLMWATREDPVFIDVYKAGYKRWGFRYRFKLDELRRVKGPIELTPKGGPSVRETDGAAPGRYAGLAHRVEMSAHRR